MLAVPVSGVGSIWLAPARQARSPDEKLSYSELEMCPERESNLSGWRQLDRPARPDEKLSYSELEMCPERESNLSGWRQLDRPARPDEDQFKY